MLLSKMLSASPLRKWALAALLLLGVGMAPASGADAQAFPNRPITIVVPYAPGATDREVRKLADIVSQELRQPIVVENKEGAGGAIGAQFVAAARADGYTLLYSAPAVITVLPLIASPPYKYEDLVPLARTTSAPHVLAARADAPFKTAKDLIAYAKANPGKVVFGSSGTGTAVHLAGEAFADAAGIKFNHVPFRGLAPAITSALGGFVDIVIGLPLAINPQVESGKMNALAQFGATRASILPNIPTLRESGVDLAIAADFGLFAPKGMAPDVLARLENAFQKAVNSDDFQSFAAKSMTTPAFLNAVEYRRVVDREQKLFATMVPKLSLGDK